MTPKQEPDALFGRSADDSHYISTTSPITKLPQEIIPQETLTYQVSNNQPSTLHNTQPAAKFTCYVIGDKTVCVHDAIVRHGGQVLQSVGWHPFRTRRSAVCNQLLSSLPAAKPTVLWVHLDSRQAYAQRPLHTSAAAQLATLVSQQEKSGRMVVLEGSWSEVNWGAAAQQLLGANARPTSIHWCGLNIKLNDKPLHAVHAVCVRNAPLVEAVACTCGKRSTEKHDHDLGSHFDQFMVWFLLRLGLATTGVPRTLADSPRRQMAVTNAKTTISLSDSISDDRMALPGRHEESGSPKQFSMGPSGFKQSPDHPGNSTQQTALKARSDVKEEPPETKGVHIHFTTVHEPVRITTHEGTNIIAMPDTTFNTVQQLQKMTPTTTNNTYTTTAARSIETQTKITQIYTFPTESRMKQKKKDDLLKALGKDPKLLRERKKFLQEAHYDDCGSDFGGIDEKKSTVTFADAVHYCFDKEDYSSGSGSSDAEERLADNLLNQSYITWMGLGSDASEATLNTCHATAKHVPAEKLLAYLNCTALAGYVDVVEFCGGQAGVSKIAIRRRLKTGMNADIVCGIDLSKSKDRETFIKYVEQHKPLVIIGAPPCTALGGWSRYNSRMHKETYDRNRKLGEALANFYAKICLLQMAGKRHWIVENPHGSDLFRLPA